MKLILDYWNRRWQSVTFDTSLGTGHVRWLARKPAQCGGWAFYSNKRWYALRLQGVDLLFQVGPDIWLMDDGYSCQNITYGTTRLFTIQRGDSIVFREVYDPFPGSDEPTTDELDFEMNDFLYWTAKVWNNSTLKETLKLAWVGSAKDNRRCA